MNRIAAALALIVLAAGATWWFPLFHIVPLKQVESARSKAEFDAKKFAAEFWTAQLEAHFEDAADAALALAALRDNPQQAREKFGHQVGVSRTTYYFLRGSGEIMAVDAKGITVALDADTASPDILLATGPVFGNAVRDATGLLRSADFPNSQHFNELPNALNLLAEAGPIQRLKDDAQPGRRVEFVGCASITGDKFTAPLKLIPVDVNFK